MDADGEEEMKVHLYVIPMVLLPFLGACAPNYSEGVRVGVVTKLSHKGLIFKSWEGSLNEGGTKSSKDSKGRVSVVTNAVEFNVSDPKVLLDLQKAYKEGSVVELEYKEWAIAPPTINNSHVITKVTFLEE